MTTLKSQDFLSSLSEKYNEFLGIIHKKDTNIPPEKLALEVREKALNILVDISEILTKRGEKYREKKGEKQAQKLISRFINQKQEAKKSFDALSGEKNATVPSMENLLDTISQSIAQILLSGAMKIGDIYTKSAKNGENGIISGNENRLKEVKTAPKFETLMKILDTLQISPEHISITKEEINEERMRTHPYYIVHIFDEKYDCTITVSDEIGQACYVYAGYISLYNLKIAQKGETLEGITPKKITYSDTSYEKKLLDTLQNIKNEINPQEKNSKISEKTPEIMRYQAELLKIIPELKKVGLEEHNCVFYFHNLQNINKWPKVGNKNLINFPNAPFNQKYNIGNEKGLLQSSEHLQQLFTFLGIPVASEEQEIELYKNQIIETIPELKKVGLEEYNGVFYFHNLQHTNKWPKVGNKSLINFPNASFNKKHNIGNENGVLQRSEHLQQLFRFLGIPVAGEKKEIELYKNQVIEVIPELKKVGLEEHNCVFYFHNLQGQPKWPKVGNKRLQSFPNAPFNKKHNIGNENGVLQSSEHLQQLFRFLGIPVASEKKEIELYKNQVIEVIPELRKVGLEEHNGVFYFHNLQWVSKWPKIGNKNLTNFPNAPFNKKHNIGNERGVLQSSAHIQQLFTFLGIPVFKE